MSPEVLNNDVHSFNTDIWSAGCILYELITLERYYENTSGLSMDVSFGSLNTNNIFKELLQM
jgi:serine/threonine protein kinase